MPKEKKRILKYTFKSKILPDRKIFCFFKHKKVLMMNSFIDEIRYSKKLRDLLTNLVLKIPYSGVYLETPPLYYNSDIPAMIVLIKTTFDPKSADLETFSDRFESRCSKEKGRISIFKSKYEKGTELIVPCPFPKKNAKNYSHIKLFFENSPRTLIHLFWITISIATSVLSDQENPIWLKTHGKSVHYLHFRIQNHSDYYDMEEFKTKIGSLKIYNSYFK